MAEQAQSEQAQSEHPNARLVRDGYAAFARGDLAAIDKMFDDEIVWHTEGRNPMARDYTGKAEVFGGFFAGLAEVSDGTFRTTIETVIADDDHVAAIVRLAGRAGAVELATRGVDIYRIRAGQVVEVWSASFDQYQVDAFLSRQR
jgi:ketosteroid isomerase-like protein